MAAIPLPRCPVLLRETPQFRYLWLSRIISATGAGAGRVALVPLAAPDGPGTVSLVLLCTALPQLLRPVAGPVPDRVDRRRLLAGFPAGHGVISPPHPPPPPPPPAPPPLVPPPPPP